MAQGSAQGRKHRGYATQKLIARDLVDAGLYPHALDVGAGRSGRDITGTPGVAIEVKAKGKFSPLAYVQQAKSDCGNDLPMAVIRLNGQGPKSIDEWPVLMLSEDVARKFNIGLKVRPWEVKRRGFDPLEWIKNVRGCPVIPYAAFTIKSHRIYMMRWGDVKTLIGKAILNEAH